MYCHRVDCHGHVSVRTALAAFGRHIPAALTAYLIPMLVPFSLPTPYAMEVAAKSHYNPLTLTTWRITIVIASSIKSGNQATSASVCSNSPFLPRFRTCSLCWDTAPCFTMFNTVLARFASCGHCFGFPENGRRIEPRSSTAFNPEDEFQQLRVASFIRAWCSSSTVCHEPAIESAKRSTCYHINSACGKPIGSQAATDRDALSVSGYERCFDAGFVQSMHALL